MLGILIDVVFFGEVVGIFDDVVVLLSLEVSGMLVFVMLSVTVAWVIFVVMLV